MRSRPLAVGPRGLAVMALATAFLWLNVGGETATCAGTPERWTCTRHPDALLLRVSGLATAAIDGPGRSPRVDLTTSRSAIAARLTVGHSELRFPAQFTRAAAEADRRAIAGWIAQPRGDLEFHAPAPLRYRLLVGVLASLTVAAAAWSAVETWRGRGRGSE